MTDAEAQRLVLQRLYEIRLSNPNATSKDFQALQLGDAILFNTMYQLAQLSLITWLPHSNASTGRIDHFADARITSLGVDSVKRGIINRVDQAAPVSESINFSTSQKQFIAALHERLARVQNGQVWGSDHPGPYTAEETAKEIDDIKARIRSIEETTPSRQVSPTVSVPLTGVAATGAVSGFTPSLSVPLTARSTAASFAGAGSLAADATVVPAAATERSTFELRLSDHPSDIRDATRVLVSAIQDQIDQLHKSIPNDPEGLQKYNNFVEFLEKLASGLKKLAEALDQLIEAKAKGSDEPIFLGTAGKIAEQIRADVMGWFEAHHADAMDFSIKIGVMAAGYNFLHVCGVEGITASIVAGLLSSSFLIAKSGK